MTMPDGPSQVTHDITGQTNVEDALRFSEARYRALYHDNPTMIVTLDAELNMFSVNPFCASQLGYTIEELEGRSVLMLFHEDDRSAVAGQLQICLQHPHQVHRWQYRKIRKDGALLWVEETAQAVYDLNGALNILVVCQDVTERKRAEEEREQLLLQLEAILENINEGVVIADREGKVVTMNKEALTLHGYESVEHKQVRRQLAEYQDTFELFNLEGEPIPFEQWPLSRALRGERFIDWEVRVRRKDSGHLWIGSYSGIQVHNESGDITLSVITVRNITERKSAEDEIKRLNANLAARAADLEATNRELEAFNYTVAHDLRNPLNVISSYCQAFKALCADKLDEQCLHYVQEAYAGTLRMNRLIEALLDFSRMAYATVSWERVDLSTLAKEVAEELKRTETTRRVSFLIADGIVVDGDAVLLRVVLANLLGNAWKYTATRDEGVIEFGVSELDGKQTCFVRDNGTGFDDAAAEKIFTPFQRLPGAEECRGFGIGLATVERIIRRHGGRVSAEGVPGKGATFWFAVRQ